MNAKGKSTQSGPTIRTSELVPAAGTWRISCERCRAIDDLVLHELAPAPPCIRCCNPTTLRFLAAAAVAPRGDSFTYTNPPRAVTEEWQPPLREVDFDTTDDLRPLPNRKDEVPEWLKGAGWDLLGKDTGESDTTLIERLKGKSTK